MAKFDTKVNGDTVDDVAYNNIVTELKNAIITTGDAIDATQVQLAEAMPSYAAVSTFYTDSGAADAYVLTPITTFKSPPSYINGMQIRFRAGNAGTGGAATVNVNGLGVKSLKEADGTTNPSSIPTTEDSTFRYDGTVFRKVNAVVAATESVAGISKLPKQITIANNVTDANNDIDFSAGNFQFSDGTGIASLSALTKRLDASWAVGTNQGGLFSGAKANSTWYHCFAIYNPTSGITDCGFDTSVSAANIPSGYTKYKRVGSIKTNSSGNIISFYQRGKNFYWANRVFDVSISTTYTSYTNSVLSVPPVDSIEAKIQVYFKVSDDVGTCYGLICPSFDLSSVGTSNFNLFSYDNITEVEGTLSEFLLATNSSSQIRINFNRSVGCVFYLFTIGWVDNAL